MHSSRMHTVPCSTTVAICWGVVSAQGRGVCPGYLPRGVSTWGVWPGVSAQGGSAQGGVYLGCLAGGVCPGGVCPGGCLPTRGSSQTPPLWTEWQMPVKTLHCHNYVADGKYAPNNRVNSSYIYLVWQRIVSTATRILDLTWLIIHLILGRYIHRKNIFK